MEEEKDQNALPGNTPNRQTQTMFGGLNIQALLESLHNAAGPGGAAAGPQGAGSRPPEDRSVSCPNPPLFGGLGLFKFAEQLKPLFDNPRAAPPTERQPAATWDSASLSNIPTAAVIASFLNLKRNKRAKESTLFTYSKRLAHFEKTFPLLPAQSGTLIDYLAQFDGATGRHRRNIQDLLGMLYDHATKCFGLSRNPMIELERPLVSHKSIRTLTMDQLGTLMQSPRGLMEQAAAELLAGHGWRQIEVRRILAGDVLAISHGLIQVHGKERLEMAPVLAHTEALLRQLAAGLKPEDYLFVARHPRGGRRVPLGEDGLRDLIKRLFERAGLADFAGHDLRRTFATLVRKSSGDEFLAMRLLRDRIPGVGSRYINVSEAELVDALKKHSPLSQLEKRPPEPAKAESEVKKNAIANPIEIKKPEESIDSSGSNRDWWRRGRLGLGLKHGVAR
jgi:integrase